MRAAVVAVGRSRDLSGIWLQPAVELFLISPWEPLLGWDVCSVTWALCWQWADVVDAVCGDRGCPGMPVDAATAALGFEIRGSVAFTSGVVVPVHHEHQPPNPLGGLEKAVTSYVCVRVGVCECRLDPSAAPKKRDRPQRQITEEEMQLLVEASNRVKGVERQQQQV